MTADRPSLATRWHRRLRAGGIVLSTLAGALVLLWLGERLTGDARPAPYVPDECECGPAAAPRSHRHVIVWPDQELAHDPLLNRRLSRHALSTANICGLVPLIREYLQEADGSARRLILRQRLNEELALVRLEITSTSAEMDCEEERADQIADHLLDAASARVKRLTLLSILLGALGAALTNGLALAKVDQRVYRSLAIVFGLAVAAIGLSALRAGQYRVDYPHARNPLAELYHRPDQSEIFPPAVWNYLNRPDPRNGRPDSLREALIDRWLRSGELGAKDEEEKQRILGLLLGPGGAYQPDELRIRANLFDQLESYINLMKHDVYQLASELARLE